MDALYKSMKILQNSNLFRFFFRSNWTHELKVQWDMNVVIQHDFTSSEDKLSLIKPLDIDSLRQNKALRVNCFRKVVLLSCHWATPWARLYSFTVYIRIFNAIEPNSQQIESRLKWNSHVLVCQSKISSHRCASHLILFVVFKWAQY